MQQRQSEHEEQRRLNLATLRDAGIDPYPARCKRTHTCAEAIALLDSTPEHEESAEVVSVVGRLMSSRIMGKAAFAHVRDGSGQVQLYARVDRLGADEYELFRRACDLGDIIGVTGTLFRTRTGEPTIQAQDINVLSKAFWLGQLWQRLSFLLPTQQVPPLQLKLLLLCLLRTPK